MKVEYNVSMINAVDFGQRYVDVMNGILSAMSRDGWEFVEMQAKKNYVVLLFKRNVE